MVIISKVERKRPFPLAKEVEKCMTKLISSWGYGLVKDEITKIASDAVRTQLDAIEKEKKYLVEKKAKARRRNESAPKYKTDTNFENRLTTFDHVIVVQQLEKCCKCTKNKCNTNLGKY